MKQYFIEKSNTILSIYTKIKAINNIYIRKNQQQKNVLWILKKLLSTPAGVVGSATSDISTHRNHTAATCGDFCTGIWHPTTIHPFFQPHARERHPLGSFRVAARIGDSCACMRTRTWACRSARANGKFRIALLTFYKKSCWNYMFFL